MSVPDGVHVWPVETEHLGEQMRFHPSAVACPGGLLLVDVGLPETTAQVEDHLAEAGFGLGDVRWILITHQDPDHAGGLSGFLDRVDATVFATAAEAAAVDGREPLLKLPPDMERYPPARVDVEVVDGVTVRTDAGPARVVETPGHCPGHCSLHLPEEDLLIAGDAVTAEAGLDGPNPEFTPDMAEAARSIERIADLGVERLVCHHGGVVETTPEELRALAERLRA